MLKIMLNGNMKFKIAMVYVDFAHIIKHIYIAHTN